MDSVIKDRITIALDMPVLPSQFAAWESLKARFGVKDQTLLEQAMTFVLQVAETGNLAPGNGLNDALHNTLADYSGSLDRAARLFAVAEKVLIDAQSCVEVIRGQVIANPSTSPVSKDRGASTK